MKGLDTNVLLRYLVEDDLAQARKATAFISSECSTDDPGLINRIVLCELVWVLESGYEYPRDMVAAALDRILHTRQFRIENADNVRAALEEYREGSDFADSLLGHVNRQFGCDYTVTFDRQAARRESFRLLR
jgi:predicted nucleic-acid-binding protein